MLYGKILQRFKRIKYKEDAFLAALSETLNLRALQILRYRLASGEYPGNQFIMY